MGSFPMPLSFAREGGVQIASAPLQEGHHGNCFLGIGNRQIKGYRRRQQACIWIKNKAIWEALFSAEAQIVF